MQSDSWTSTPGHSPEIQLLHHVERLARHRDDRLAVHLHLSKLQPNNRRSHHLRVAANLFRDLVSQFDGQIYELLNADLVFIGHRITVDQLDSAVTRVRRLFSEDPLTIRDDSEGDAGFCSWYRLEDDYDALLQTVQKLHRFSSTLSEADRERLEKPRRAEMTPADLSEIEGLLSGADLTGLMRNQAVCAFNGDGLPLARFREYYVSINELRDTSAPKLDLTSNPWLFLHLTQTLDRRLLSHLSRGQDRPRGGFSLNLNIQTILSPDFERFDQNLAANQRQDLVIELQKVDVFSDVGAYLFARDFAQERGYRVCIDGLTHLTLPFINREQLGADLLKIHWSPEMEGDHKDAQRETFRHWINRTTPSSIILSRCDTPNAIEFGKTQGIGLFQGRYIDRLRKKLRAQIAQA